MVIPQVVAFQVERFDLCGMPPTPGYRVPQEPFVSQLLALVLMKLHPYIAKSDCENVSLRFSSGLSVNVGIRRQEGNVFLEGTIDAVSADVVYVAFAITIHGQPLKEFEGMLALDAVSGTGYIGTQEQIETIVVSILRASEERVTLEAREEVLRRVVERLRQLKPRPLN